MTGHAQQFTYTLRGASTAVNGNRRPSGNGRKLSVQVKSEPQTAEAEIVALEMASSAAQALPISRNTSELQALRAKARETVGCAQV
jgi:hypothetical protein